MALATQMQLAIVRRLRPAIELYKLCANIIKKN